MRYLPGMLVWHPERRTLLRVGRVVESDKLPDIWLEGYCQENHEVRGFWAREGVVVSRDLATAALLG